VLYIEKKGISMKTVSRKRYQEALRFLKAALRNDKLSFAQRFRAVELLVIIYGDRLPDNKRDRKTIKELMEERSLERNAQEALGQNTSSPGTPGGNQRQGEATGEPVDVFTALLRGDYVPKSKPEEPEQYVPWGT
jgi:hypothetical protein